MGDFTSELRDGMRVDWDVPITMDDGLVLRADVFRPPDGARSPVLLSYGPFGKGLAFQEGNRSAWERLIAWYPEVAKGSSNQYQSWEVVDPEKWVPDGYAVVRVDSRGAGRSPGFLDVFSPRETLDLYHCIEWAAAQPWSTGKVGLNGISYYSMNAWCVAGLQPPHLAAMCIWEGAADYYREAIRHGGILSQFMTNWYPRAAVRAQHGLGERGPRSPITGETVCGPETLSEAELAKNRIDVERWMLERPLDGPDYRARSAVWEKIRVPFLSAANWGGQGLHTRGNFEGYVHAASAQKWLEVHGHSHWTHFYTDYGVGLQKRFFGHVLKGTDTGWASEPPVRLQIRHPGERFVERHEREWPLARTQWTRFYLDPDGRALTRQPPRRPATIAYDARGDGVMFLTPPLEQETEITGPSAASLVLSSTTRDADVFLVLRVFAPDGAEVTFHGAQDPRTPVGQGWLRASHRKLDPARSLPYRPWHTHDELRPLTPGEAVEVEVEIWPTCIVVPRGHRIGLAVRGKDYEHPGPPPVVPGVKYTLTGVGPFRHDHPADRPAEVFGGTITLHVRPDRPLSVLLPIIPPS
jgi:hypothetical protein